MPDCATANQHLSHVAGCEAARLCTNTQSLCQISLLNNYSFECFLILYREIQIGEKRVASSYHRLAKAERCHKDMYNNHSPHEDVLVTIPTKLSFIAP